MCSWTAALALNWPPFPAEWMGQPPPGAKLTSLHMAVGEVDAWRIGDKVYLNHDF